MQFEPEKVSLSSAEWLEFSPVAWTPLSRDEKLAALVGYMTGDGTVASHSQRYTRKSGEVSIYDPALQSAFYSNSENDLLEILEDCRAIGIANGSTVRPKKTPEGYEQNYQLQLSARGTEALVAAGAPVGSKTEQEFDVPLWIKDSGLMVKRAYLAALFGAEGTAPAADKSSKGRTPRNPTINMCKKAGYRADAFFESLSEMARELGVDCETSVTERKDGYLTYWLRISKTAENASRFFDDVGFVYCENKALLAWKWSKYLKAYTYAANQRVEIALSKNENQTFAQIGEKLGITRGAAHRLRTDLLAGKSTTAGHMFPHFEEWMADRWIESLGLLRIAALKKKSLLSL